MEYKKKCSTFANDYYGSDGNLDKLVTMKVIEIIFTQ